MDRAIIRHGFILLLLALIAGFAIPAMRVPRLGLSAHTIGVLSGLLLVAVGFVWDRLKLGPKLRTGLYWMWLFVAYGNWLGTLLAAVFGGSQLMPIAGSGAVAEPKYDLVVTIIISAVGVLSITCIGVTIWGLRNSDDKQN